MVFIHCVIDRDFPLSAEVKMRSPEDENDTGFGNYVPEELSQSLANGTKFVDEVLSGRSDRCLENFRMDKQVFYKLCDILQAKGLLRHTSRIKIEEQLAIFLFIIGHNLRTRAVQELFRYSGETISRHFNNVLNAIMGISLEFFNPPGSDIPPEIFEDPRFYPYSKDCVGTVDGIHVPVAVGIDEQGPFRNKNGLLSQNVLAACSFDLKFHYVLAGWEGSASDLRVLNSALTRRNKLQVPEGNSNCSLLWIFSVCFLKFHLPRGLIFGAYRYGRDRQVLPCRQQVRQHARLHSTIPWSPI
ncbi:hypothetical protein LINGRAHAP2_LOCUS6982 [Linum grandiflorum]